MPHQSHSLPSTQRRYFTFIVQDVPQEPYYNPDMKVIRSSWDGNTSPVAPYSSHMWRVAVAKVEVKEIETDSSSSDEDGNNRKKEPTMATLSRQERKALDREIPWR